jgi:hypothetical protein
MVFEIHGQNVSRTARNAASFRRWKLRAKRTPWPAACANNFSTPAKIGIIIGVFNARENRSGRSGGQC